MMEPNDAKYDPSMLPQLEQDLSSTNNERRWKAAAELTGFVAADPDAVWPLVLRYGSSDDEDLRTAVATCVLEHILEHYFERFFPQIEREVLSGNHNLKDTLKLCWKLGEASRAEHAARWESLLKPKGEQ